MKQDMGNSIFNQLKTQSLALLLCFFLFSCLKDVNESSFKFFYLPTSLSNIASPFGSNGNVGNSANFSISGGKSLYGGIYYASAMTSGRTGLNLNLTFANVVDGTELRVCLNNPGCGTGSLLHSTVLAASTANLDLNLSIPGTYPVNVGGNSLNVSLVKDSQIINQKSVSMIYDNSAPSLSLSVLGGTYTSTQSLSVTCTDSISGCKDLIYTTDGTDPSLSLLQDFDPLQIVFGSVFPSSFGIGSGTITIKILASDRAGNLVGPVSATYTVNLPLTPAPTLTLNSIQNGTTNGSSATSVNWTSDSAGDYFIVPTSTDCLSITPGVTIASGTLVAPDTQDTTVPTGAFSEGNNSFKLCLLDASNQVGSFNFNITLDTSAPTLASTSPSNGAVDTDVFNRDLILTFNESMQPGNTIEIHALVTFGSGGGLTTVELTLPSSVGVQWISGTVVKIDLDSILPEFSLIKVKILAASFKDVAGNPLIGDGTGYFYFSYTTGGMVALRNIIDSNQPGCFDTAGSGIACGGTGQDGAFSATPSLQSISTPNFLGGFTNDPISVDSTSGLTWRTCVQGMEWNGTTCAGTPTEVNWPNALSSCSSLNERNTKQGYAGLKGWRLATMDDFHSLITFPSGTSGYTFVAPASFPNFPSNASNQRFWSSTTNRSNTLYAFVLRNFGARVFTYNKNNSNDGYSYYAFCVNGNP
ncbi:DUF1566 domain-containing protein [Leptospira adleri]|uniref:Uncharacterized protein n=1 Tax=Leptospira adleri TaxID=2023186 RepID=A0A2M9YTM7_9LEPT|nr:DUF1566 domain-containing protein [Leptospira adleri]PJZ54888.1 hypothetical protein CH380_04045 [Leptospira adleri]PJZ60059.1 hypothetical protein CH376_20490 [Leptospira adleri]